MPTYAYKVRDDMSNEAARGPSQPAAAGASVLRRTSSTGSVRRRGGAASSAAAIRSSSRPTASRPIFAEGLLDRRQVERLPARHVDVVETDDGEVVGDADPDAARRVERAEGDEVVGREDRRRPRSRREQVEAPLVAAVVAELPDAAKRVVEGRRRGDSRPSRKPSLSIAARRRVLRSGDERDAAVPQVEHRLGDRVPSGAVVGDDGVDRVPFEVAVDEDDGNPAACRFRAAAFRGSRRRRRARRPRRH